MQIIDAAMNQESVISDIESRARRVGVPIRDLCRRAGLNPTTFSRWKRSSRNPEPIGANLHSIGRLYDALNELGNHGDYPPAPDSVAASGDSHRLCGAAK